MKKLIASILSILIFTLTYNGINIQYAHGSSESKYIYVYAHENSSFAIREDGSIWQWGQMSNGEIRVTPTLVTTLPNAIKCTSTHVLTSDGSVWSFNSKNSELTEITVLSDVVDIQEEYYTLSDGSIGSFNYLKQLNDVDLGYRLMDSSLITNQALDSIKLIKRNYFLKKDGTIWNYTDNNVSNCNEIQGLTDIIMFDSSDNTSDLPAEFLVALKNDGTVLTLDYNNKIYLIDNLNNVVQVSVGGYPEIYSRASGMKSVGLKSYCFCLRKDGTVWSIGDVSSGQAATLVEGLTDVKYIDTGREHSIALTNSGEIYTWGNNTYGQLGIGCSAIRKSPQKIAVVPGAVSISSDLNYITLCKNDGTVWELNLEEISNINSQINPIQVSNIKNASFINGRNAIDKNGYVWVWDNERNADKISDLSVITAIAGNFALKNDGTVWAFYSSFPSYEAKGLNNVTDLVLDPVRVSGSAFGDYSNVLVLKKDGTAWEIPSFLMNGLADGSGVDLEHHIKKINISAGSKKIAAPNYVLKSDGTVSCGEETISELKDVKSISTYSDSKLFALKNDGTIWLSYDYFIVAGITNAIGITVGGRDLWDTDFMSGKTPHQIFAVLEKDGSVFVWGNNEDGLLNPFGTNMNTPVKVCSSDAVLQINSTLMSFKGEECEVDPGRTTTPVIVNGRTLVPIRNIIEKFGGTVAWDEASKTVTLALDSNTIELQIDSTIARVNDEEKVMDVAPCIINSRTMLPLRFISENLGISVEWNNDYRTIYLDK